MRLGGGKPKISQLVGGMGWDLSGPLRREERHRSWVGCLCHGSLSPFAGEYARIPRYILDTSMGKSQ